MRITVYGVPVPQGSKSAFVVNGRAVVTDGKKGPALKEWRSLIRAEAQRYLSERDAAPLSGPVALAVTFFLPRPRSAPKRVLFPATKPDLDKLTRAVGDALCKVAYEEDSRIVDIIARKRFAIDTPPRVEIALARATATAARPASRGGVSA